MTRKLYLINQFDGKYFAFSKIITELFHQITASSNIEVIEYNIKSDDLLNCIEDINKNANIIFILHDFTLWNDNSFSIDNGRFSRFIRALWMNKGMFICPTEIAQAALLKSQLVDNSVIINKIILNSEGFKKQFLKLGIQNNKLKCISIPIKENKNITFKGGNKETFKGKIILTTEMINTKKDFFWTIENIAKLIENNNVLHYIISLKSNPTLKASENQRIFEDIKYMINSSNIKIFLDVPQDKQDSHLRIADIVLFVQNNSLEMYNEDIIQAIMFGKPIVASASVFTDDLVKNFGIFLYQYQNNESFFDAISILLDNLKLSDILSQQNIEASKEYRYENIIPNYMLQFKKLKN